jgi:hypothetical protein
VSWSPSKPYRGEVVDDIVLPVPDVLAATYLVVRSLPLDDPVAIARGYLDSKVADPLRNMVGHVLGGPLCTVEVLDASQAPKPPLELLRVFGASAPELRSVATATHTVAVRVVFRPGWPPVHEWGARVVAAGIASATDAPVIDAYVPRLTTVTKLERTYPDDRGRIRLVDWVLVPQSAGDHGMWFTTKGMGRFGLPELQTRNVPPQLAQPWTQAFSGLASALLRWWVGALGHEDRPPFVELPSRFEFTRADVAVAYGAEDETGDATAVVRLALEPSQPPNDSFLDVLPPDGFSASSGEFFANICADLFGHIAGDVRYPNDSSAMDKAIAYARATLTDARRRFVDRTLGLDQRLIVKFRLPVPGGHEYPWLFVTSWKSADRIHGTSANDAQRDPAVRVGKPLVIGIDHVVDWGIWIDGRGLVEGGWTNTALGE